jgi:hypothetical protein
MSCLFCDVEEQQRRITAHAVELRSLYVSARVFFPKALESSRLFVIFDVEMLYSNPRNSRPLSVNLVFKNDSHCICFIQKAQSVGTLR